MASKFGCPNGNLLSLHYITVDFTTEFCHEMSMFPLNMKLEVALQSKYQVMMGCPSGFQVVTATRQVLISYTAGLSIIWALPNYRKKVVETHQLCTDETNNREINLKKKHLKNLCFDCFQFVKPWEFQYVACPIIPRHMTVTVA